MTHRLRAQARVIHLQRETIRAQGDLIRALALSLRLTRENAALRTQLAGGGEEAAPAPPPPTSRRGRLLRLV